VKEKRFINESSISVFYTDSTKPVFMSVAQAASVFASPQLSQPYFPNLNHPTFKKRRKY